MISAKISFMLAALMVMAASVFPSISAAAYLETKDGAKIYYEDQGKGQPIVLVHGWTCSSKFWQKMLLSWPKSSGWLRSICAAMATLPRR
jgi:hypothetical protein